MDLNTITPADFRAQFPRDFPYLPVYDAVQLYNAGAIVYYAIAQLFYKCLANGTTGVTPGTDPAKWALYTDAAANIDNYVQDADITRAFAEAQVGLNQALCGSDTNIRLIYLYLTAHYLVNDLRASAAGLMGSAAFPVQSKTVGSVSITYGIPQRYLDDPILSFYTQSAYGLKYLSLILPALAGNVVGVCGGTTP